MINEYNDYITKNDLLFKIKIGPEVKNRPSELQDSIESCLLPNKKICWKNWPQPTWGVM